MNKIEATEFSNGEEEANHITSLAEIRAQFDSEWVLVEDPQTNDTLEVQRGKVRHHSKDPDEVYRLYVE